MIDINANCYVAFDEAAHKYTDLENEHYISATQFLEKFHSKFEDVEDFWLIYKSIQYCSNLDKVNKVTKFNEELNDLVEEFLIENIGRHYLFTEEECQKYTRTGLWKFKGDPEGFLSLFSSDHCIYVQHVVTFIKSHWKKVNKKATTRGTAFHNEQENISFSDGKFEFRDTIFSTCCNVVDLANLTPNTLYPELRLYNKKYKIAGTSDQVLLNSENKIIIRDFKTNCEIKTSNKYENFFEPISHLQVCEYTKYSLQLSLYAWMLEQFGYEIDHIEFIHHTLDDNNKSIANKIYKCPYLKDEIEKMLEHYKNSF